MRPMTTTHAATLTALVAVLAVSCDCDDNAAGPQAVEIRLSSCATLADQGWDPSEYSSHEIPDSFPCPGWDGALGCPKEKQNEFYRLIETDPWHAGWRSDRQLLEYRRCLENEGL